MRLLTQNVQIAGTASALPETVVRNADLVDGLDTTDAWIRENLGILERRVARDPGESTVALASEAGLHAIQAAGLRADDIDATIVATATPDQKAPSSACLVQNRLGIRNQSMAFDIHAVCTGFLYALGISASLIEAGAIENALVIGADTFSTITDWSHRSSVFFGDGAGAAVVQRNARGDGLLAITLHADGSGHEGFHVPPRSEHFVMNPRAVYETGTTVLPEAITNALELAGRSISDMKVVVPHQPSRRVLDKTAESLGVDPSLLLRNMDRHANTAGATVPLLLDQTVRSGQLAEGDDFVMAAVGSGWTWGAAVMKWGTSQ